ncbi:XRE family transcriptional regulator [Nordella sp. HKS 07]|uniref:helix-turn-helix domain-containing protein n=1 Tax=Nordella sp. HKS 07 TaxID=2712222 RepID=UPI0013E1C4F3|nr:XRE family transcriptional regulator [Nordella sp. HKS 07]QIG51071.1 XRE family transcriptional regulator [Nordella sp. HKS 07]
MSYITHGSVWNALYDDPIEAMAMERRSLLLMKVQEELNRKGWTQNEAAKKLGVDQSRMSDLKSGKISKFTVDSLLGYLDHLGQST